MTTAEESTTSGLAASIAHALVSTVPLGAFCCSLLFDLASHRAREIEFARPSFWLMVVGLVTGVAAGLVGLVAVARLESGTAARALAVRHVVVTDVALAVLAASMLTRRGVLPEDPVRWVSIVLSAAGTGVLAVGAGLGVQAARRAA